MNLYLLVTYGDGTAVAMHFRLGPNASEETARRRVVHEAMAKGVTVRRIDRIDRDTFQTA